MQLQQLQLEIDQQVLVEAQEIGKFNNLQTLIENALREYIDQHSSEKPMSRLADKKVLQAEMEKLLSSFGLDLTRPPLPIEQLQQQMRAVAMGPYELSQGIITAREE